MTTTQPNGAPDSPEPSPSGSHQIGESVLSALRSRTPQSDVKIIDAHAHVGPYSLFAIPRNDPTSMVRVMDRCGVATALISSNLAIQLDADLGNDATASAVDAHPGRFLGYAVANPWREPQTELRRWELDERFVGVKVHPDLHHYRLDGPRYDPVWTHAEATGRPVLTHTWVGSEYDDLDIVARVARRHPEVQIIAGHAGVKREGIDRAIGLAHDHPNVHLEICGSHGLGVFVARMVSELGAHRVIFGTDFPFIDSRSALGRVLFAGLSDEDLRMVLAGSIQELIPALRADADAMFPDSGRARP